MYWREGEGGGGSVFLGWINSYNDKQNTYLGVIYDIFETNLVEKFSRIFFSNIIISLKTLVQYRQHILTNEIHADRQNNFSLVKTYVHVHVRASCIYIYIYAHSSLSYGTTCTEKQPAHVHAACFVPEKALWKSSPPEQDTSVKVLLVHVSTTVTLQTVPMSEPKLKITIILLCTCLTVSKEKQLVVTNRLQGFR